MLAQLAQGRVALVKLLMGKAQQFGFGTLGIALLTSLL